MTSSLKNYLFQIIMFCLLALVIGCASTAGVTIPAQQEFVLGELQNGAFKASVENTSTASIQVLKVDKLSNKVIETLSLPQKQQAKISASSTEKLLLKNTNNQSVKVKVKLNKGVEGMRYQAIPKPNGSLLSKDSLIEDLQLLEKAMTQMHPGIYRYNNPTQIAELFAKLRTELPDQISEGDFMIRLAQTTAQIKCGHTYLNPWNMNKQVRNRLFGGKTFLPVGFTIIDGKFYVTENATDQSEITRGAEILAINGMAINRIYEQLRTTAKMDGNNESPIDHYLSLWNYEERNWHAFDLYFQLFYPLQGSSYTIMYRNFGDHASAEISLPAMTKRERTERMKAKYGEAILERETWNLEILSEDLAVMKIGTFAIWNWKDFDPQQWFANAFQQLDSLSIPRLAVDIRGNGGGLTAPANELLSYLIRDTLRCDDLGPVLIRTTKFDPDLMPYMDTWVEPLKVGLPEDLYAAVGDGLYELLIPSECQDLIPQTNRFKGEVFLFGGPSNVSATYTMLDKANRFGFATSLGQVSGGNQQGINGGEYVFFTMPYSKMEVDIPLKYFSPASPSPDAGVLPQVPIRYSQKDIATGRDPFLEYLKK